MAASSEPGFGCPSVVFNDRVIAPAAMMGTPDEALVYVTIQPWRSRSKLNPLAAVAEPSRASCDASIDVSVDLESSQHRSVFASGGKSVSRPPSLGDASGPLGASPTEA